MGTVGYMSPEQVRGLPVDARSDIFSFGAILYELLSGKKAFKRDTAVDSMLAILKEEPPELSTSSRNIPPALDHVVAHCLEKERGRPIPVGQGHRLRPLGSLVAVGDGLPASSRRRRPGGGRWLSPLRPSSFSPPPPSFSCGAHTEAATEG